MTKVIDSIMYDQILDKLVNSCNAYEKLIEGTRYSLWLANGDFLNIRIERGQVPHLLGVNTDLLKIAANTRKNLSAYDLLKKLVDRDITEYTIKQKGISLNSVFSDYIMEKLDGFVTNLKIRTDDIYAIVKYNKERAYTTGQELENSDYFIIRNINRKYYVLGVVGNDADKNFIVYQPVTSRIYEDEESFSKFLHRIMENQEITYANSFKFENYGRDFFPEHPVSLSVEQKLRVLGILNSISQKYKCIPSVSREFAFIMNKLSNSYQKINNNAAIYRALVASMENGTALSAEEITEDICDYSTIGTDLSALINKCNDLVCSKGENVKAKESYSAIQQENSNLKAELEEMKKQLEEVKQQNQTLTEEKKNLEEESEKNKEIVKLFDETYEKYSKMK